VIRYTRTFRLRADNPHSALTQPAFSMRCKAGYKEPSSICRCQGRLTVLGISDGNRSLTVAAR
jgi:hypothetical protein